MDTWLQTLTREECLTLLGHMSFGRVVYTEGALPSCTPVNYALDGAAIAFRTAPGSRLARATADAVVAFEVDDVHPTTRSGWSVLVTGVSQAVREPSAILRLEQLGLAPWIGADDRSHWVRITPTIVSGRRLLATPLRLRTRMGV
jgi:nitroimidazol reductase NimA-like FMN-containing flavoprotein (pyridoxamine 5'-phosphate oxidase superfamily)